VQVAHFLLLQSEYQRQLIERATSQSDFQAKICSVYEQHKVSVRPPVNHSAIAQLRKQAY
jgi:hypothetical protein